MTERSVDLEGPMTRMSISGDSDDIESVRSDVTFLSGCTNSKALQDAFSGIDFYLNLLFKLLNIYVMIALATAVLVIFSVNKSIINNSPGASANPSSSFHGSSKIILYDYDSSVLSNRVKIDELLRKVYSDAKYNKDIQTISISTPSSIEASYGDYSMDFLVANSIPTVESSKEVSNTIQTNSKASVAKIDPFEWNNINQMLFVLNLNNKYVLLLNKFNTLDEHALLVTKSFKEQSSLLSFDDLFHWMYLILSTNSLGLYNSNYISGASQKHKHMQIVPRKILNEYRISAKGNQTNPDFPIPLEDVIHRFVSDSNAEQSQELRFGKVIRLPIFKFSHGIILLNPARVDSKDTMGEYLLACYNKLLESLFPDYASQDASSLSYNLLLSDRWMLMVKRSSREFGNGVVGVNAMGFAGLLLARNSEYLGIIETVGPLKILEKVSSPV